MMIPLMKPTAGLVMLLLFATALAGCFGGQPDPECELLTWEGYEITIVLLDGSEETRQVYPSPEGWDADRDGVDDCVEFLNGTDPNDPDTSGNGLLDGRNVTLAPEQYPTQEWVDRGIAHEELPDGRLVFLGSAEWGLDPTKQDHAGSGILDGEEVGGFSVWILGDERIVTTNPRIADTSADGMTDGFKRDAGLDPSVRDTNGDGVPDAEDVNPWIEFKVRLEVVSVNLTQDPFGRSGQVPLVFQLDLPGVQETTMGPATLGETTSGEQYSTGTLHPSNRGGNFVQGEHNVTFSLTWLTYRDGEPRRVDLFSETVGSPFIAGAGIHGLTGGLTLSDGTMWPSDATFYGDHGDVTLRLVPVWPDDWQACIDEGCRHGAGEFEWR